MGPIKDTGDRGIWADKPEIPKRFIEEAPEYKRLCQEVAYILEKRIKESGIVYSSVTHRVKELSSFAEKIDRKECKEPFSEITDIAGVRLVYLYLSDLPKIEKS